MKNFILSENKKEYSGPSGSVHQDIADQVDQSTKICDRSTKIPNRSTKMRWCLWCAFQPSWLHSLSVAALLSCVILPCVAILLSVSFNKSKDTFPVGITSLPIWMIPGLLKSRTIPFFSEMGFLVLRHSVLHLQGQRILRLSYDRSLWLHEFCS